jgi:hypothetical protein
MEGKGKEKAVSQRYDLVLMRLIIMCQQVLQVVLLAWTMCVSMLPLTKTNGIYVSVPTALCCAAVQRRSFEETQSPFCIKKEISVKVRHSQATERCNSGKRVTVKVVVRLQEVTCTQRSLVVSTQDSSL